jgi:hypothetical protein
MIFAWWVKWLVGAVAVVGVIGGAVIYFNVQIEKAEKRGALVERVKWEQERVRMQTERAAELRDANARLDQLRAHFREQLEAESREDERLRLALETALAETAGEYECRIPRSVLDLLPRPR